MQLRRTCCALVGADKPPPARPPVARPPPAVSSRSAGDASSGSRAAEEAQQPPPVAKPRPPRAPRQLLVPPQPAGHTCGFVAIVGKPNAGKSTLLNALVGQKLSSVTAKPQTTRHRILGILSGPAHQVVLVDTPGVLAVKRTALDGAMMRTVRTALTQADVVAAVVDAAAATRFPGTGLDGMALTGEAGGPPLVVVLTKCDLLSGADAEQLRNYFAALPGVSAALRVSALAKTGLAELEAWVVSRLPLGPALYPKDDVTEHPERFFVAECVREAIFTQYRQEIPYCTTVAVVAHREGRNGAKDVIKVQIAVERESQKGILVGKAGAAIKQLAIASRAAIEEFLQRPVYLEMVVVVAPKWRSDEAAVEKAGVADANALFTM